MPRKMLVVRGEHSESHILTEVAADNEKQLQERIKNHPDLLPIDEFGMTGPLMVIGRETTLPSGAVDLVALARSGELLVIEFKTGPSNPDFRAALAQLVDYGSDLWQRAFPEFETTVPLQYFSGPHCRDPLLKGKKSLKDAAVAVWENFTDEEWAILVERLTEQLTSGGFHYVLVAQRFIARVERTIEYFNAVMPRARFYAVELVRFAAPDFSAYESRTIHKPGKPTSAQMSLSLANEDALLTSITNEAYRQALTEFLEFCRGQRLKFEWGAKGTSIRLQTSDAPEPLTVAWLYPPGVTGWSGTADVTLGYSATSVAKAPSVLDALNEFVQRSAQLPGAQLVSAKNLSACRFTPPVFMENAAVLQEHLALLVQRASTGV